MTTSYPFGRRGSLLTTFGAAQALIIVFAFVPAIAVIAISFTDISGLPNFPVNWVGIQNYITFFSAAHLGYNLNALGNTLVYALSTTVIINVLALGFALLFNQRLRGTTFYRALVFMPTVLGVTVIGLIWSLVFNPSGGPAAAVWKFFGASSAFFGDPHLALTLVIAVQIWSGIGVAMVIYLAGLQAIPADLYEVASIDGATPWQKLRHVTFPLLAPSVTANVLLSIIGALQSYQLAYVLTGPSNPATQLLSLAIFAQGFGGGVSGSQGYAAAISVVQFVIVGIISLAVMWYLRRRESKL
ncbi:sugar ABC transporter permease [Leifsonia shinshuensis]|uniref:carbohydrate ABC transporter permease n=1 Tax=Leifsonia shinshuensis TaxID=150026 RepID=UPI001F512578|nr:sugar ABC transporter permease [Leifsonia shinshuensis]MCI0158059.1 sugar ABC transporter permease [Leifsonia shinshuensis]